MSDTTVEGRWPAITHETCEWESSSAVPAARARRGHYEAAVPALIQDLPLSLDPETAALAEDASLAISRFDAGLGGELSAFGALLLRSEAVASSQIENLTASARQVLTAELGPTGRRNAAVIVANTRAMEAAITLADDLETASVLEMHRVLMESDPRHTPGAFRDEPVWIGTSSLSPIGADFVAPQSWRVPDLVDDAMAFARRDDLPILAQIAIAHAQFETIHPFTDGNGRTGRALAQAMLRGKQLSRNVTVPVSAGLLADIRSYHLALTSYRAGEPAAIIRLMSEAALRSIANAGVLVRELQRLQSEWAARLTVRKDSAAHRLLSVVARQPVLTAKVAAEALGIQAPNVYPALRALEEAGILKSKTEHKIGTVYRADEVLAELDAFSERAGRRGM